VTDGSDTFELLVSGLGQDSVFDSASLSLSTISQLLWAGYGVTPHIASDKRGLTVPSASALYFLTQRIYLVADTAVMRYHNRLPPGYDMSTSDHRLELVTSGDRRDSLRAACPGIPTTAPVYIVLCGVAAVETTSYGAWQALEPGFVGFQYLMQAHELGLQGWLTAPLSHDERSAIVAALGLQGSDLPIMVVAVGEPALVLDVGVTAIVAPAGTVDSGTTITPQARVKNFGNNAATFPVKLSIDTGYANTQTVTNLAAGDSVQVSFTSWTAVQRGPHATRCTTALTGDQNHTNDTLSGSVMVRVKDIGVVSINKPAGSYGQGEIVTPAATIRNYGNVPAGFEVWMLLRNPTGALYYSDSVNVVNLDTAKNLVVDAFRPCTLQLLGDWTAKCSTALSGDLRLDNNVMTGGFKIRPPWVERKSVPGPPSYRPVKDGAWLAYDAGSGLVYAGKGNNSSDFYSYDIADNDWTSLRAIPLGLEAKLPRQGACGVGDGSGYIYMAKGNNTLGFWRYDIATDSWLQLANLPVGGSGRRVKAGSGVAYVQIGDSGFVYLLKGPTCEFYRFNVATGTWGTMQSAPAGSYSKWYDGSFLVFDGDHAIYAHKARYHELWAYDVLTATWSSTQLNGMPFVGRDASSRRSRGGGSGAWFAGGIYALKGGSTSEFWRYDATADTWTEFNQLPLMGSSGNRKVSAGGCIVSVDDTLFALKGNQTTELWRYGLGSSLKALQTSHEGVMAEQAFDIRHSTFDIRLSPNPLASGFAVLRYSLPKAGLVTLNAFDVAGRTVLTQTLVVGRTGTARFDLRKLEAGVYIVKVTTEGFSTTQKLVVEH
jgi:hypothetical protein